MFLGHFAAALATKRAVPNVSLGWLFAASQLPDLLWPVLLLTGVESATIAPGNTEFTPLAFEYYPWSHSLLMCVVWGAALAMLYVSRRGQRRQAMWLGVLVVSHWILDWITHAPDLPLVPGGGPRLGLALWNSVPATLLVETAFFAGAIWLYTRGTTSRDRTGTLAWIGLVGFLAVIFSANAFGPPPPNMTAVAISVLVMWLLVFWGAWVDRHRAPRRVPST